MLLSILYLFCGQLLGVARSCFPQHFDLITLVQLGVHPILIALLARFNLTFNSFVAFVLPLVSFLWRNASFHFCMLAKPNVFASLFFHLLQLSYTTKSLKVRKGTFTTQPRRCRSSCTQFSFSAKPRSEMLPAGRICWCVDFTATSRCKARRLSLLFEQARKMAACFHSMCLILAGFLPGQCHRKGVRGRAGIMSSL